MRETNLARPDLGNHTFGLYHDESETTHTGHVTMDAQKSTFCANGLSVALQPLTQTSLKKIIKQISITETDIYYSVSVQ